MVGHQILNSINLRLQQIKNNKLPFGGIGILLSGDFFQLHPVRQKALYDTFIDYNKTPDLFNNIFTVFNLPGNMRVNSNEEDFMNNIYSLRKMFPYTNPITPEILKTILEVSKDDFNGDFRYATIAVTNNMEAFVLNEMQIKRWAFDHNQVVIKFNYKLGE